MRNAGVCYTNIMLDNVWIFRGLRGEEPPNIRKLIQVMDLHRVLSRRRRPADGVQHT